MATQRRTRQGADDPIQTELDAIKRLMIMLLLKQGARQGEIAVALGVDQAELSRMFPARKLKDFINRA